VPDDSGSLRTVSVVSYDLDEMLGTKLRALLQREQGRDLFDFWCAWQASKTGHAAVKVNPARVGAAFRFYMDREGSSFSSAEVRRELERRMKSRKFLNDMNGYLPVGYSYSPQQAFDEFNSVFLPHLDG
jgi:predicted nucleotidyltransferase component of viral defense system